MATHDYPLALIPRRMEWRSLKAVVQSPSTSPFTGATESVEFPAERFAWSLALPDRKLAAAGQAFAFFARLSGGMERVRLWHFLRPVPTGSMRGAPTLAAAAVRGAQSLQITTTGTLLAGDMFKVGNQVFMAFQDCAPVAGVLTVPLVHRVRAALASGAAVQWDRPTFLCVIPAASASQSYEPGMASGMQPELMEVFS